MKNKLKTIILATAIWLLTPSCASMYRGVGTFEPCLPRDKENITIKQKMINYINKSDSLYTLELKDNSYIKDKQLRFERKFMGF